MEHPNLHMDENWGYPYDSGNLHINGMKYGLTNIHSGKSSMGQWEMNGIICVRIWGVPKMDGLFHGNSH